LSSNDSTEQLSSLYNLNSNIRNSLSTTETCLKEIQELITIVDNCDIDPAILTSAFRQDSNSIIDSELVQADVNHLESYNTNHNGKFSTMKNNSTNLILDVEMLRPNYDDVDVEAIVDTGAVLEYMSENFRAKYYKNIPLKLINTQVRTADGSLIDVVGLITVQIKSRNRTFDVQFIVLKNLTHSIILGLNFGEQSGMIIDLYTKYISFSGIQNVPLSTTEQFTIPAHCETWVPLSYNKSINRLPNEIWLESSTAIRNRFGIHVAKGIANRSTLQALVANLSEQPLCIPANTIIAYGCSLS